MDKEIIKQYAPIAFVVIALLIQWNVFSRPVDLELLHREILSEVAGKYVQKEQFNDLKVDMRDMQVKIDRIYDKIIGNK